MARIRTIKPEFPQSESMGRVSRDSRLLFVMLWTICDDHGRTRAHSRMLASLLFPYDEDAGEGIKVWLQELEEQGCIKLYEVDGAQYLQVVNWTSHQKIDRPSRPLFPGLSDATREGSRGPREGSSGDQGPKDQGTDQGQEEDPPVPPAEAGGKKGKVKKTRAPSALVYLAEFLDQCRERGEKPIQPGDSIFKFADDTKIPRGYIRLAWREFLRRHTAPGAKRQKDWRAHFRNSVRGNWGKVWYFPTEGGEAGLTTVGIGLQREMEAEAAQKANDEAERAA
jgi:hypothetical protein